MKKKGKAMVLCAFIGDSLALGAHWIYNTKRLEQDFGRVEHLLRPRPGSYHATKEKGELTHYGDQAFVLLESIEAKAGFDLDDFSSRWRTLFKDYTGYVDQATRVTLSRYRSGKEPEDAGSPSDDLAGASRVAPILYAYMEDETAAVSAGISQTKMTHNHPATLAAAEFFTRVAWRVLHGERPVSAMEEVAHGHFENSPIATWVLKGTASKDQESVATVSQFGQSCHTQEAFPGVVHLIAKYEENLKEALIQSVMAGGDNAARAMIVGTVLGASLGLEGVPEDWISGLRKKDDILRLLAKIR